RRVAGRDHRAVGGDGALAGHRADRRRAVHAHAAGALADALVADAAVVRLADGRVRGVLAHAAGGVGALAAAAHEDVEVLAAARARVERLDDHRLRRRHAADRIARRREDQLVALAAGVGPGFGVEPARILVVSDDAVDELRVGGRPEVVRLGDLELR